MTVCLWGAYAVLPPADISRKHKRNGVKEMPNTEKQTEKATDEINEQIERIIKAIFTPLIMILWGIALICEGETIGILFFILAGLSIAISILMFTETRKKK